MQRARSFQLLSRLLCMVLIAAMALGTSGCGDNRNTPGDTSSTTVIQDAGTLGQGDTEFFLTVTDQAGESSAFTIHSDAQTVGEALMEVGLLTGEEGPYGLFIQAVNGITADFDADGTYWAFYIDGEYAMSGVDATDIVPGTTYTLKVSR